MLREDLERVGIEVARNVRGGEDTCNLTADSGL